MPGLAATVALSAFLLFMVQPVIAKQILPWFGGSASVWTTCLLFFQSCLLAGYAYSDVLARRLPIRRQVKIHAALLVLSLVALPIVAPEALKPARGGHPVVGILLLLAATVGFPYLLLSTTGPLMQAWAVLRRPKDEVYRLYALSNAASMAGLALYPFVIEPWLPTRVQALAWSIGYAAFVLLAVWCGVEAWRAAGPKNTPARAVALGAANGGAEAAPPSWRALAPVLFLSALGSTTLLAVTNHVTRDVAAIPFLWLAPLLLYLLSFVVCFELRDSYRRAFWAPATAVSAVAMLWTELFRATDLRASLPVHALGLFAVCMTCHGELVSRRPAPQHLTTFYLVMSTGGAVGGVLVGIVAPLVLVTNFELTLALCAVAAVLYLSMPGRLRFVGAAALLAICGLAVLQIIGSRVDTVALSRNFYGSLRISRVATPTGEELTRLTHGVILHGQQVRSGPGRRTAISYFGEESGIGRALLALERSQEGIRVGIVGLGAGILAAYGRPGDVFRFYELDPDVERHARTEFSYLEDSAATVEVVIGDGRLALEREPRQGFHAIVVDAFSSDSIPVHLLTRNAMSVYRKQLREGGLVAFHITNRYLDLAPVVADLAASVGMVAWQIQHVPETRALQQPSTWVIVTANLALLERFRVEGAGVRLQRGGEVRPWTDDYSNLFQVLHFRSDAAGR